MRLELLLLIQFVFLTLVAYLIAINSRGIWRVTLSFLLATCMLGGTVWVVILQYSTTARTAVQTERRRFEAEKREVEELLQSREQTLAKKELMGSASRLTYFITQARGFARMLQSERMQDPGYTHEQLMARAAETEKRFSALNAEMNSYKQILDKFPESSKFLGEAMTELKDACRLYRAYYVSENAAIEQSAERQMRQRARNALAALAKSESAIGSEDE